jgi:FHA domain/Domain of unknown function (DUF1707)
MVGHGIEGPRASDEDRDRALAMLRDASADGRLSHDTLMTRIDAVLHATSHTGVEALVADLQPSRTLGDRLLRTIAHASSFIRKAGRSWRLPWLPPLCLPAGADRALVIGRSPDCDLVLSHPTISRRHAQLRPRQQGWELLDLGSTNGTRVNGWPLGVPQAVHAGDVVSFGALSLAVTDNR